MAIPLLEAIDDTLSAVEVRDLGGGDLPGCIRLWRHVILNAVADAVNPTPSKDRERARKWLTEPSEDHLLACDLAGFDPGLTLHRARELAARNWKPLLRGAGHW
jgi:hypothetical protein